MEKAGISLNGRNLIVKRNISVMDTVWLTLIYLISAYSLSSVNPIVLYKVLELHFPLEIC